MNFPHTVHHSFLLETVLGGEWKTPTFPGPQQAEENEAALRQDLHSLSTPYPISFVSSPKKELTLVKLEAGLLQNCHAQQCCFCHSLHCTLYSFPLSNLSGQCPLLTPSGVNQIVCIVLVVPNATCHPRRSQRLHFLE